jgi:hypothetical protein
LQPDFWGAAYCDGYDPYFPWGCNTDDDEATCATLGYLWIDIDLDTQEKCEAHQYCYGYEFFVTTKKFQFFG